MSQVLALVARADNTGLGVQTFEFARHMKPDKIMVVDIGHLNKEMGKETRLYLERYHNPGVVEGIPTPGDIDRFLEGVDIVFTIEIPYNYYLFERAEALGVKTVLQYNFEFLDYLNRPELPQPDLLLAPSVWNIEKVKGSGLEPMYIPVPVNREVIPFRQRTEAKHFLHIAGHKTFMDRNGTQTVIEAMKYVKSDIKLTIYSQQPIGMRTDRRTTVKRIDVENYWELYKPEFDVMLLPRKYGGLSLQLNEGLSAGMPVIMPDVEPQNTFLPKDMLIPTIGFDTILTRAPIECWQIDPKALAEKIDELVASPTLVSYLSQRADEIATDISWKKLLKTYKEAIYD